MKRHTYCSGWQPAPARSPMRWVVLLCLLVCIFIGSVWLLHVEKAFAQVKPQAGAATIATDEFFEQRIRPVLATHCYDCHTDAPKAGLRVDSRAALLRGGTRGAALVPGQPETSLLYQAVAQTHATLRMPKGGGQLSAQQLADLRQWIADGAPWPAESANADKGDKGATTGKSAATPYLIKPEHRAFWSFQPIGQPTPPPLRATKAGAPATSSLQSRANPSANPIDAFLLAELQARGLGFNPAADRRTLLRRITFDLTGLPPSVAEYREFLSDARPDAYARVVARLLASPAYGERWARHWLDVARYSDTVGLVDAGRNLQAWYPFAYTYRDWVIRVFNEDLPYDQFITQQLAADRLPQNEPRHLAALGFLALTRGGLGVTKEEKLDDKVDLVTRGLLGLTVSCARCHNHKFDPIPTRDYYALFTIFSNTREPDKLPYLDPQAATQDRFVPLLQAEEKKIEADVAKLREKRYPELQALYRSAPEIEKALLGVYDARALRDEKALQRFAQEKDHNLYVLKRWRTYLAAHRQDALWQPFDFLLQREAKLTAADEPRYALDFIARFIATPQSSLLTQALTSALQEPTDDVKTAASTTASPSAAGPTNAVQGTAANVKPRSLRQIAEAVAAAYGKLLAAHDQAQPFSASATATPEAETLRQALRGTDAPPNFPFADYDSFCLSTDKQNERGKRRSLESLALKHAYEGAAPRAQCVEDADELQPGYVLVRGNPANKGERVTPQFLQILAGDARQPFTQGSGRLELARAVTDARNPLTARVLVNRVWAWHFGRGIVTTTSDFGTRGAAPTHPALLDFLARWLMEHGWSLKQLHTLIVTSQAYQQASSDNAPARAIDPENQWLWRFPRRRLSAEELRDALLTASGKLDRTLYGLPTSAQAWPYTTRRTIYAFLDRALVPNDLRVFDFAAPDAHAPQRYLTTVPQQALLLMNSPFVLEQAQALLQRAEVATARTPRQRITALYQLLYGRAPSREELALGLTFVAGAPDKAPPAPTNTQTPNETTAQTLALRRAWRLGQGTYDEKAQRIAAFQPFAHFINGAWRNSAMPGDPRTPTAWLAAQGGFPSEERKQMLVRRWTAPADATLQLSGSFAQDFDNGCRKCDGITARFVSNRAGELGHWQGRSEATVTALANLKVQRGETLDFVFDARQGSVGTGLRWTVTLTDGSQRWDSARDFTQPGQTPLNLWERYAQTLLMAVEFMVLD